ncbi:MAG: hypothetical protein KKD01_01260 [Proteobacteria bacterium]|nr:hypothetical protein [Pseudomonadota bacterium]MBU1418268.1 hypothetical protein [Pseudomonadota bacterium]MBU1453328.1 hypothetical protein [Pseudomonadota bacterium]
MEKLIQQILEWPIIVQGALGSGLFWLLLRLGQKVFSIATEFASKFSKAIKKGKLKTLLLKYRGILAASNGQTELSTTHQVALIYISLRYFIKGLIWICFGIVFQGLIGTLGVVGFIGGLYYLFQALSRVQYIDPEKATEEKVNDFQRQLDSLEN